MTADRKRPERDTPTPPRPDLSSPRRGFALPGLAIFLGAFLVRAINIWQLRDSPFLGYVGGDGRGYDLWAQEIAGGSWLGTEVFWQAPLYPYFLAVVYALFGHDTVLVRFVQAALGAGSCLFLALAGHRLFNRRVGILTGVIFALYAPAIFYDGLIQKTVFDLFFLSLAIWIVAGLNLEPTLRRWCALGGALAGFVLVRENALLLVPVLLVWLWFHFRSHGARRLAFAACFVGVTGAILLSIAVRNQVVGGEFHLTTSSFGLNFYIGNNKTADGGYQPPKSRRANIEFEHQDAIDIAEGAEGRALTPREVSQYWTRRAIDDITDDPLRWVGLMGRKVLLMWNRTELMDTEDLYAYADYSLPLRLTGFVFHLGVLAPLALAGFIITWPRRRTLWPLYLMLAAYMASVLIFYVFGRYRLPMVPFLILLAAGGLAGLPALLRTGERARLVPAGVAALIAAVFCNVPNVDRAGAEAAAAYNAGTSLELQGRSDEAIAYLEEAIRLDPAAASAHYNLGAIRAKQGDPVEAQRHFENALAVAPDYAEAWFYLGVVKAEQGLTDQARDAYEESLRHDPALAEAHNNLGRMLLTDGDFDGARSHFERAVAADPDLAVAQLQLGRMLELEGDNAGALTCYEHAARATPESATAQLALGRVLARLGSPQRAFVALRQAVTLDESSAEAHRRLGALLLRRDAHEAIPVLERAIALDDADAGAHNDLGTAFGMTGAIERAIAEFEKALAIDPGFEQAQKNLERARGMRGG